MFYLFIGSWWSQSFYGILLLKHWKVIWNFLCRFSCKPTFEHHFSKISLSLLTPVTAPVLCLESVNIWGFCTAAQSVCVTVFTHCTEIHSTVIRLQLLHCERPSISYSLFSWVFIISENSPKSGLLVVAVKAMSLMVSPCPLSKPIHVE